MNRPSLPPWRLAARSVLTAQLRQFFWARGFLEVDTPIAIHAPAQELAIDAVPVALCADPFARGTAEQRFLQPSPELSMKRLLAQGFDAIFQVAAVFRDGDRSEVHAPEFRLLEWYRVGAPYTQLMDDCEALIGSLMQVAGQLVPEALGSVCQLAPPPWPRWTVDSCFQRFAGFSLFDVLTLPEMVKAFEMRGWHHLASDTWDDLFYRLFVGHIEPELARLPTPVFISQFPASQAALARLCPEDPRVAERFELYACGLELANAFGELTCATEQRSRFNDTRQKRAQAGSRDYPLDEAFLSALKTLPPTSGIALGVERLMMVLLGANHIDDVSFVPWHTI